MRSGSNIGAAGRGTPWMGVCARFLDVSVEGCSWCLGGGLASFWWLVNVLSRSGLGP